MKICNIRKDGRSESNAGTEQQSIPTLVFPEDTPWHHHSAQATRASSLGTLQGVTPNSDEQGKHWRGTHSCTFATPGVVTRDPQLPSHRGFSPMWASILDMKKMGSHSTGASASPMGGRLSVGTAPLREVHVPKTHRACGGMCVCGCNFCFELVIAGNFEFSRFLLTFCKCLALCFFCCIVDINPKSVVQWLLIKCC